MIRLLLAIASIGVVQRVWHFHKERKAAADYRAASIERAERFLVARAHRRAQGRN